MRKLLTAAALVFASQFAFAPAAFADSKADCEAKAVSKDGKPLHGAAKSAFMKKCMSDAKPADSAKPTENAECAAKAVGKDGKPLHGAARSAFMKKCVADAGTAK